MIILLRKIGKRGRHLLAGGLFLCATASLALTLGPNTRSAVLGQPLDISIQMMLDSSDDPKALCLEADVFYVDKQLDRSSVDIVAEKLANTQESVIRIRAAAPVEGPVVTVHLRAGCVQKTSRRYVVLAATKTRAAGSARLQAGVQAPAAGAAAMAGGTEAGPTADKVQAMESELRQMREELQKNQAAIAESKVQLEKAETSRFVRVVLFGLLGLLTVGGLIFLSRQRSPDDGGPPEGAMEARSSTTMSASGSGGGAELDLNESLFDELKRPTRRAGPESIPPLPPRDRAKFSVSVPFVQRTVKVPELFDLQQQVEFFSSLGQQDKAIALLREHLVDNVKTSALVYLDLLDLYHQTGNEEDYEVLRADFNRVFNTQVASFHRYSSAAVPATSANGAVLERIQGAWGTRRVLDVIEDALFREPGNPAEVLHLEAYRELLLLHAVAREIGDLEAGVSGQSADTR
ncbi:MAG TPA: hypothetical protein VE934_12735, partial [Polaromonas sp.]|nr:hypothetical protein [Polaromonas sp.]